MNSGTLRGFSSRQVANRVSQSTSSLRGDGEWVAGLDGPFARPASGEYVIPWATGRTTDLASTVGNAVAAPFFAYAGDQFKDAGFRFHSATTAGIVYASVFRWSPTRKTPTGRSVADLGSKTSFGSPGTHFWYSITSLTWRPPETGWYCLVLNPTGETITFQCADAIPTTVNGGSTTPNVPTNGQFQGTISGSTYVTTDFDSSPWGGDGLAYMPLIRLRRA